jgi:hypothetical protein
VGKPEGVDVSGRIILKCTVFTVKTAVFLDVAPCRFLKNRRFGGTCRLHLQGKRNTATQDKSKSVDNIKIYRPSDRRLSAKLVPTFADRGCRVVSATDPYGRILGFLDRSRYFPSK